MPSWKKVITSGSDASLNSLNVTNGITGSLLGTASYATQALSASYAPGGGNVFPFNGDAQISGSLGVTGSFSIQTFDGINYVPAISLSNFSRTIYDVMGTSSFDADGRTLFDDMGIFAANWSGRTLLDSTGTVNSLAWNSRLLYDTISSQSIDWALRLAYDTSGTNYSIDWSSRLLADQSGFDVLSWDAITNNYKIDASTYLRKSIGSNTQESFSDVPATTFNYEGEEITGQVDGTATQFDLVYLETDGKWYPVTQATADCSKLLGICAFVAGSGGNGKIILEGSITVNDGTYTDTPLVQLIDHGLPIYIRESAGNTMSTNVPTTAGQYVRILGHAYYQNTGTAEYWIMKFRPSHEWIEL